MTYSFSVEMTHKKNTNLDDFWYYYTTLGKKHASITHWTKITLLSISQAIEKLTMYNLI